MVSGKHVAPAINLRNAMRLHWPEWITLALYAGVVSFAIPFHEPWADEAQAWQLARSLPLHDLFRTYLGYEGSPGLWHFLLWIMVRTHISYACMHWICGAIALVGVSILVLKSPFPRYIKLLLPFTYFLLFQYAVVARSYVLVPLVLFLVAACWKRRPLLMGLMLGLLANIALHTAIISGGLAIAYFIEKLPHQGSKKRYPRQELILSLIVLLVLYAFAVWTAWPPHDLLLSRVLVPAQSFLASAVASLVWGICQPWILAIPFWIAIALCLRGRRRVSYLLPVLIFALFCGGVDANLWHAGLLVPLAICVLWVSWPTSGTRLPRTEIVGIVAVLFLVAIQVLWSAKAISYDHSKAFSPNLAAARFLSPLLRGGATIAVTYLNEPEGNQAFDAVGLLPYFDRNIYLNQPTPYWSWSDTNPTEARFAEALRGRPTLLLVEVRPIHSGPPFNLTGSKVDRIEKAGYRMTNVFCGTMPDRLQEGLRSCHLIFRRAGRPQNLSPQMISSLNARTQQGGMVR